MTYSEIDAAYKELFDGRTLNYSDVLKFSSRVVAMGKTLALDIKGPQVSNETRKAVQQILEMDLALEGLEQEVKAEQQSNLSRLKRHQ